MLYADIQMSNDEILEAHKVFIDVANDFHKLVKIKNIDEFVGKLTDTKEYFGPQAVEGQQYTDKIIYLLAKQVDKIKQNVGKTVQLENIYTKQKKIAQIDNFDGEFIYLSDGEKLVYNEWVVEVGL